MTISPKSRSDGLRSCRSPRYLTTSPAIHRHNFIMEPRNLTDLPIELLALICSYLQHQDVLPFALTCRLLNQGASDEIRARQKVFREYCTISDERPLFILDRLRGVVSDPFKAQCVRRLECFHVRLSWRDWAPPNAPESTRTLTEVSSDDSFDYPITNDSNTWKGVYGHDELENFRRLLRLYIFSGDTGNTWSNAHISMLRHGHDDAIKVLLIALCRRLQSVTFYSFGSKSHFSGPDRQPLIYSFLAQHQAVHRILARESISTQASPWPPGFQSLRSVSLCAPLPTGERGRQYYFRPPSVSGLFWLPNIEKLELNHLRHRHDSDSSIDIAIGCSSVRTLKFKYCRIQPQTMLRLITSSKKLEQVTVSRCGDLPDHLETWIRDWYEQSLRELYIDREPAVYSRRFPELDEVSTATS